MAKATKKTYIPTRKGSYKPVMKMEVGGNVSELNYTERKEYIEQNYAPFIQEAQMIFNIYGNSFEYDYKKDRKEVVNEIIEYYRSLGDYTEETLEKETIYKINDWELVRRELDPETDEYYDETELEQVSADNTYNFSYLGLVDLNWRVYYDDEYEKYFYVIMPHLGGDIRGNYGEAIILEGSDKEDLFYRFYEEFISGGASIYFKFIDGSEVGFDSEQDSDVFNFRVNEVFEPTGMAEKFVADFEKFDTWYGDEFLEETIDIFLMRKGEAPKMMAGGSLDDETPKAYIQILGDYNEGKWIDLTDYSDGNDVIDGISEWMNELNEQDGGNREEYRVADFEGFGNDMYDEYMGMNEFDEIIEAYEKYTDNDFPNDVIFEYKDNMGSSTKTLADTIDDMENNYFGRYDDYESFGIAMVDEGVYTPSVDDVYMTDTDKRILAGEEADSFVDGLSFEDALEIATDVKEKYDTEKTELEEKIMYLDSEIADLEQIREDSEDEEYDLITEQIEEKEIQRDEFQNELDDIDSRFEDEAFNEARDIQYDIVYDRLENDLEDWLDEYGYSNEDLSEINFLSVDYKRIGEYLASDYLVIEYDRNIYVFNNYGKGGRTMAKKRKPQYNFYIVENSTKKLVSGYNTKAEAVEQRKLLIKEYPSMRFEIFTLGNLEAKTNLDVNAKKDYVELSTLDKIKQVSVDAYRYGQEKAGQVSSFLKKHDVKGKIKRGATKVWDKTKQGGNWLKRQWEEADFGDGKGKAKFFADGGESDDLHYIYIKGRNEDAPEPLQDFGFSFIGEDSREQLHNWLNQFINEPAISVEKILEVYRSGNTKDVTSKYLSFADGGGAKMMGGGHIWEINPRPTRKHIINALEEQIRYEDKRPSIRHWDSIYLLKYLKESASSETLENKQEIIDALEEQIRYEDKTPSIRHWDSVNLLKYLKNEWQDSYADGGGVDDFKMSYDEMTAYEKSNHIHYNPMNSRWEVTKNGEHKEFWNQEQAEKYAGFEFDDEKDSRYSRKRYEALFGYSDGGDVQGSEILTRPAPTTKPAPTTTPTIPKPDKDNPYLPKTKPNPKASKYDFLLLNK